MNLIVPVNLQALRVSPNDASLITKQSDLFAGPTTSFEGLPWRGADYQEHWTKPYKANVAAAVSNPLWGGITEQLDAGVHLHWALPDGLSQGVQQADGTLAFAAVPNRWLVTRIITIADATTVKQWIVESDRLITEDDYIGAYYPATKRKVAATPVGWTLAPGTRPEDGGAVYGQPWRRLGRVFELSGWQPAATPVGATPDKVLHLDELPAQLSPFAAAGAPVPLRAVGPGGPAFAAYYPDSRSVFGFHDTFGDLAGADLANIALTASYIVSGWHSHASDDPLQTAAFKDALGKATAANAAAPASKQVTAPQVAAGAVQGLYRWVYDPTVGTPTRCLYGGQLAGLAWDTTGNKPSGGDPKFPKCFLQPLPNDPTVRVAVGNSAPGAMAALVKHEWSEWANAAAARGPLADAPPPIPPVIADNLEFLIDALQLGLLHELGSGLTLPQLEQALHQSGFGAAHSGTSWIVRAKRTDPDKTDPHRFDPPDPEVPDDDGRLGTALATLNAAQARLDSVLGMIDSCRRQIFVDWNLYISQWGAPDGANPATVEALKGYISAQILDLWAKLDAAFGVQTPAAPATGNLPAFYADGGSYLSLVGARYQSPAPAATLAGQIAAAANAVLDMLAGGDYTKFELASVEAARFWQPNEPVVVATGDSLRPAQRNGVARFLPCRLTPQLIASLDAKVGADTSSLKATDAAAALALAVPAPTGGVPEAQDTAPLMPDVTAMLGEACLLDPTLSNVLGPKLGAGVAANLAATLAGILGQIATVWAAGPPEQGVSITGTLANPTATAATLQVTLPGQAPQGLALTAQPGGAWQDPFLPLFLVWEVSFEAYEKGQTAGATRYDASFITSHFGLDAESIDLAVRGTAPATQGGAAPLQGFIPLSSRAAQPLLDQIRQYLQTATAPNPQLQSVIDHLKGKPLLSQGLSGLNPALQARAPGMQLAVFNPFYYSEAPATALGAGTDTFAYANVLTHFVGAAAGALADQVPLGAAGFNPLRSGGLTFVKATVVDVFGRRRTVIDSSVAADADKVVVSAQLQPPTGLDAPIGLPPRLAETARLRFDWVSGNDGKVVSNSAASTSPVTGWLVFNHLDNSLMFFAPSGAPLGSLGVFGAQANVTWQSAPGHPARTMATDLGDPNLAHLLKFGNFLLGKPRAVFDALTTSIEDAHTYILPDSSEADLPYAVLMGRPLALVRAELRLELPGLPAFNSALASVQASATANGAGPYDPTLRDDSGLSGVTFPVRLGDRDNLADGLVGYLIDSADPYATLYAPAAPDTGGTAVQRPGAETLLLTLHPALDPPGTPYANAAAQTAALRDPSVRPPGKAVTMLIDPRASVNATTGVLPIKELALAAEIYGRALRSIEVSFFTHPILRGAQALDLPAPSEPGFTWAWTMGVRSGDTTTPSNEPLTPSANGDRASFDFTPQEAQDGWLTLVPQPSTKGGK